MTMVNSGFRLGATYGALLKQADKEKLPNRLETFWHHRTNHRYVFARWCLNSNCRNRRPGGPPKLG